MSDPPWRQVIHTSNQQSVGTNAVLTWGTSHSRIWWWTVTCCIRCPSFSFTFWRLSNAVESGRGNSVVWIISLHTWTTFTVSRNPRYRWPEQITMTTTSMRQNNIKRAKTRSLMSCKTSCSVCKTPLHDWSLARDSVIISRWCYPNSSGYSSESVSSSKYHVWFASRCLGRRLSTWQMIAASCPTALDALCGQLTYWLACCREHSAVMATELFQLLDLTCGTLCGSSYAILTSFMDCLEDS